MSEDFPTPAPEDEGAHPPRDDELFNESWYFDAVAEDGSLGAYVRVGSYPNLGVTWYTTYITGPDRTAIAVLDFEAPLPAGDELRVETERVRATHRCERPLERFAVSLEGTGEAHVDHSAPLRGEAGGEVDVVLDLTWETDGTPYSYRRTTRYEVPCVVDGTVRTGTKELRLRGPGQRDHSWGVRDWWGMDWVWSAGRLEDGTRVHAVQLRLPDGREVPVGYVQDAAAAPRELEAVAASESVQDDGLIGHARLELGPPGELALAVEPLAFGPLRLEARDGRVSSFPRAMCRFTADDGRTGLGWVEWNRNLR